MPQSMHVNYVHIIFSTKHRQLVLDTEVRPRLFAYMSGILRNLECYNVTVGGARDHVHILCNLTKKHASINILEEVKKDSSKWLKTQGERFAGFH